MSVEQESANASSETSRREATAYVVSHLVRIGAAFGASLFNAFGGLYHWAISVGGRTMLLPVQLTISAVWMALGWALFVALRGAFGGAPSFVSRAKGPNAITTRWGEVAAIALGSAIVIAAIYALNWLILAPVYSSLLRGGQWAISSVIGLSVNIVAAAMMYFLFTTLRRSFTAGRQETPNQHAIPVSGFSPCRSDTGTGAVIAQIPASCFAAADENSAVIRVLPVGAPLILVNTHSVDGTKWTSIVTADGKHGFIPASTKVRSLKRWCASAESVDLLDASGKALGQKLGRADQFFVLGDATLGNSLVSAIWGGAGALAYIDRATKLVEPVPPQAEPLTAQPLAAQAQQRTKEVDMGLNDQMLLEFKSVDELRSMLGNNRVSSELVPLIENELRARHVALPPRLEKSGIRNVARERALNEMLLGAVFCIGGSVFTYISYQNAVSSGGGTYIITWGAIVFGAIRFLKGLGSLGS